MLPRQGNLTYPIPPESLLRQALGPEAMPESYLYGGYVVSEGIRKTLQLTGKNLGDFKHILDFGCGCARVLRWFDDLKLSCQFHGTDISQEAIRWCKENIRFAKFGENGPLPPLPFPDESFHLVYGISVLSHFDEQYQYAWLEELQRIVKPGGVVILTVHGDQKAYVDLSHDEYTKFEDSGFTYKRATRQGGLDGLPDFYQLAYHSRDYVERIWRKFFKISAYVSHGPVYGQDLILMEETMDESRTAPQCLVSWPSLMLSRSKDAETVRETRCADRLRQELAELERTKKDKPVI